MGVAGGVHIFSMGNYFPHDIIIFPLGYKIGKLFHNLHVFAA